MLDILRQLIINIAWIFIINSRQQIILPPILKILLYLPFIAKFYLFTMIKPAQRAPEH